METEDAEDRRWMRRALALARRGLGRVAPNPPVGCVLVRDGRLIGAGWHQRYGDPHAEAEALADARRRHGDAADALIRGATAYATLMPCNHHGRQPPCSAALARAGVARVVAAGDDPNLLAAGGRATLEAAGVRVTVGVLRERAEALMRGFLHRIRTGRPYVLYKCALTLDGKTATANGDSRWISGPDARRLVHRWRADADAVLVGVGTVLADDPALNVRDLRARDGAPPPNPRRVVWDSAGRTPTTARIFSVPGGPVIVCCGPATPPTVEAAWRARGVAVERIPPDPSGRPDVDAALRRLAAAHGVNTILCEGGAELAAGLLAAEAIDEIAVFVAPKLCGGRNAPGALGGAGVEAMAAALTVEAFEARRVGRDWLFTGKPVYSRS